VWTENNMGGLEIIGDELERVWSELEIFDDWLERFGCELRRVGSM